MLSFSSAVSQSVNQSGAVVYLRGGRCSSLSYRLTFTPLWLANVTVKNLDVSPLSERSVVGKEVRYKLDIPGYESRLKCVFLQCPPPTNSSRGEGRLRDSLVTIKQQQHCLHQHHHQDGVGGRSCCHHRYCARSSSMSIVILICGCVEKRGRDERTRSWRKRP